MVRHPLVSPATLSADGARLLLRDEHLHAVLVADGDTLLAVVERPDLGPGVGADAPARELGRLAGRIVGPDVGLEATRVRLVAEGRRRLAVVDAQHRLLGLLCLKRTGLGFCSDADVAARACEDGRVPPVGLEPTLRPF